MKLYLRLLLGLVRRALRSRNDLLMENLVLRQQLAVYARRSMRARLRNEDRVFWSVVSRRGRAKLDPAAPDDDSQLQIAGGSSLRAPRADGILHPHASIRVRIGINAGEPVTDHGDLFGACVQLAARICDKADADQILVTGVVRDICVGTSVEFIDGDKIEVKGFDAQVPVFVVPWH